MVKLLLLVSLLKSCPMTPFWILVDKRKEKSKLLKLPPKLQLLMLKSLLKPSLLIKRLVIRRPLIARALQRMPLRMLRRRLQRPKLLLQLKRPQKLKAHQSQLPQLVQRCHLLHQLLEKERPHLPHHQQARLLPHHQEERPHHHQLERLLPHHQKRNDL